MGNVTLLIWLRDLPKEKFLLCLYFGIAVGNVNGSTLCTLSKLPIREKEILISKVVQC